MNYYLQQDFGYYTPNTNEQKAKLTMLRECSNLITAIVESVSSSFKAQILKDMIPELCVENLLDKVVEIFHFKVGVEPDRQAIYYQDKVRILGLNFRIALTMSSTRLSSARTCAREATTANSASWLRATRRSLILASRYSSSSMPSRRLCPTSTL